MRTHSFNVPMSANDVHVFPAVNTERRRILELSGVFGGATAALGFVDPSGGIVSFKKADGTTAITITAADGFVVEVPSSGQFAITLTGATAPTAIKLTVSEASQ